MYIDIQCVAASFWRSKAAWGLIGSGLGHDHHSYYFLRFLQKNIWAKAKIDNTTGVKLIYKALSIFSTSIDSILYMSYELKYSLKSYIVFNIRITVLWKHVFIFISFKSNAFRTCYAPIETAFCVVFSHHLPMMWSWINPEPESVTQLLYLI